MKDTLPEWQSKYPNVEIKQAETMSHPHIKVYYLNGACHKVDLKNKSAEEVLEIFEKMRQRTGRPMDSLKLWPAARTFRRSLQGQWNAALNFLPPVVLPATKVEPPTVKSFEFDVILPQRIK